MSGLRSYLEDIIQRNGKVPRHKFFDRLGSYFNKNFGPDWREKDRFFLEFEEELKKRLEDQ